jgi:hypothetical protein
VVYYVLLRPGPPSLYMLCSEAMALAGASHTVPTLDTLKQAHTVVADKLITGVDIEWSLLGNIYTLICLSYIIWSIYYRHEAF